MDELKNLVIQSLETNGVLGQVRAQLRSCVFKVIDNQEQVEQKKSNFHWENPKARQLRSSSEATLMAELIKEFMEFYRLDYSLTIFKPETNITGETNRNELAKEAGLSHDGVDSKPLLLQMMEQFMSGGKGSGSASAFARAEAMNEMKIEAPSLMGQLPPERSSNLKSSVDSTEKNLERATNLLQEIDKEQQFGMKLGGNNNPAQLQSLGEDFEKKKELSKQVSDDNFGDNYDDDFDDDIEEDLPEDQNDLLANDNDANERSANVAVTVSQSLGVDPSVDSLALEDYDHVEPVERIG